MSKDMQFKTYRVLPIPETKINFSRTFKNCIYVWRTIKIL